MPEECDRQGASNVIAEHRPRVGVGLLDGRAGEADERRNRQGIAQVAGEAVGHLALLVHPPAEAVLQPVRFILTGDALVSGWL